MARHLARVLVPVVAIAVAGIGAALALRSESSNAGGALEPHRPLPRDGWWNSRDSSPLAYAHPAVLFVDTASGALIDSWDRRTHARVERPIVHWSSEWPGDALIVVDAVTGDLLTVLHGNGGIVRG